MIPVDFAAEQ